MTAHALRYSEFLSAFKKADTKEEQAVVLIDIFQQVELAQEANITKGKEDILNEIKLHELATKSDLKSLEIHLIKWVAGIILGGIWIPLALALLSKHLGLF